MSSKNLYVHHDRVSNHVMTRAINLESQDFVELPKNLILVESSLDYGRYDVQTNFKIVRGQSEVADYLDAVVKHEAITNWIDFETMELMHQLTPNEIAELLYLFHANTSLRSAFFYKLQNNYVYLTLPNGLNKVYYRHLQHFYPRLSRVATQQMAETINYRRSFFLRRQKVTPLPLMLIEELSDYFPLGLKFSFSQVHQDSYLYQVPIFVIEDQITLLSQPQTFDQYLALLIYDTNSQQWRLDISDEIKSQVRNK